MGMVFVILILPLSGVLKGFLRLWMPKKGSWKPRGGLF